MEYRTTTDDGEIEPHVPTIFPCSQTVGRIYRKVARYKSTVEGLKGGAPCV